MENNFICEQCKFELYLPIVSLYDTNNQIFSSLGLYDDARFPGRCILSLHNHYEHIEDMPDEDLFIFMKHIKQSIEAIKSVTQVDRVNIAILGNTVSHVHAHLIPRYPNNEKYPNKSPWNDDRVLFNLNNYNKTEIIQSIKAAF
jgi:diadenosine tetraphosphate (Ap4A) HIT family hydrolase